MRARLIAVGERMPAWVADGFAEYRKRLSHELPLELVEIKAGVRGKGRDPARAIADEGAAVRAALQKSGASCDEAVLIGDTPYDIEAGRRAGIEVIAVRCGGTWSDDDLTGASLIVDDPAALLAQWRGEELRSGVMPALGHRGRARKRIPSR